MRLVDMFDLNNLKDVVDPAQSFGGRLDIVQLLHRRYKIRFNEETLNAAIVDYHLELVRYLHEELNVGFTSTTVPIATRHNDVSLIEYLIDHGAPYATGSIRAAAMHNCPQLIDYLFKRGGNVTMGDLNFAAYEGSLESLQLLVSRGVPCPSSAITYAIDGLGVDRTGGQLDVVRYLLENGVPCEKNAVELAIVKGLDDVVKLLLPRTLTDLDELVDLAAEHGQTLMMERLVSAGAKCSTLTLQLAINQHHYDAVVYLCSLGLTPDRSSVDDQFSTYFLRQLDGRS